MVKSFLLFAKNFYSRVFTGGVIVIFMIMIIWGGFAQAADTDDITATVTATNLAVSVSGDGQIAFGSVALDTATTTAGHSDTQTVNNDGSTAHLNVKGSNATGGTTWTLDTSNVTTDHYRLEVSTTTGASYMNLVDASTYTTASTTFTSLTSGNLDFRLTTPADSSDFVEKSITITVQVAL